MPFKYGARYCIIFLVALTFSPWSAQAQGGNAGAVHGTVTDPTGAVVPGATIHLTNAVSGLSRSTTSDATGGFEIPNVPFNSYQIAVSAPGFAPMHQTVDIRSLVGTSLKLILQIESASQTVTVEATDSGDLVENDPTFHTDVDRKSTRLNS